MSSVDLDTRHDGQMKTMDVRLKLELSEAKNNTAIAFSLRWSLKLWACNRLSIVVSSRNTIMKI